MTQILKVGEWYCHKTGKELHIGGTLEKDDIYMVRYPLFATKWLTIYIHRFLRSDGEDHHDHPFNFWSYIAKGEYTEEILEESQEMLPEYAGNMGTFHTIATRRKRGSLAYRPGTAVHRVIVDQELKYADRHKGPLTMVIFTKRYRTWGFWPLAKNSWIYGVRVFKPWYEYLGIDPNSETAKKHQ